MSFWQDQFAHPSSPMVLPLMLPELSMTSAEDAPTVPSGLRVLLIDSDGSFGAHFQQLGERRGIQVELCRSAVRFDPADCLERFDVALIAYSLDSGEQDGIRVAACLKNSLGDFPVVLMSSQSHTRLPRRLRGIGRCLSVNKRDGLAHVFASTLRCCSTDLAS